MVSAALLLAAGSSWAQTATATATATPTATSTAAPTPTTGKVLNRSKASLTQTPSKDNLKPSGPVTITAKSAELVQGSSAVYTGDVLNSNTLKLDGDRVELQQYPGGDYLAKVTGGPAHVNHAGEGPDNPPLAGRAKAMNYDSRSGILDMIGDAYALRGTDEFKAETMRYIVKEHRILADGGQGRVTVILQPRDDSTLPPEPSPSAPPAPATPDPLPATPAEKTP